MLVTGTGDGAYRVTGLAEDGRPTVERTLDAPRVECVRTFDGLPGAFAATGAGLYHSTDGRTWTDLGVPREATYSVGASPDGQRLYAGTRPSHVYVTPVPAADSLDAAACEWRELDGFTDIPSREDWGVARHGNRAQVRALLVFEGSPDRVVAGVEPGGVHVSDDGGETWTERRDGLNDDVHGLHATGDAGYVAATGGGLYRTADAGRSWTRLDDGVDQHYFRAAHVVDGVLFAAAASAPPVRWDAADPAVFAWRDGDLATVSTPRPGEVVVGWTTVAGTVVAATHRGTLLAGNPGDWRVAATVPTPDTLHGNYVSLATLDA